MTKLVIATLGFDEKLVLRAFFKVGLDRGDTVLLVYSKTGDPYDVERVEKAASAVKSIVGNLGVKVVDSIVTATDFVVDVTTILNSIVRCGDVEEVVATLVGGMRLVIIETVVALSLYKELVAPKKRTSILAMREDGLYDVLLPFEALGLSRVTRREIAVLITIARENLENARRNEAVKVIASKLGVTEYTVYKYLSTLEEEGLIDLDDNRIRITLLGELIVKSALTVEEKLRE